MWYVYVGYAVQLGVLTSFTIYRGLPLLKEKTTAARPLTLRRGESCWMVDPYHIV
jgi:hypothetical protein